MKFKDVPSKAVFKSDGNIYKKLVSSYIYHGGLNTVCLSGPFDGYLLVLNEEDEVDYEV